MLTEQEINQLNNYYQNISKLNIYVHDLQRHNAQEIDMRMQDSKNRLLTQDKKQIQNIVNELTHNNPFPNILTKLQKEMGEMTPTKKTCLKKCLNVLEHPTETEYESILNFDDLIDEIRTISKKEGE